MITVPIKKGSFSLKVIKAIKVQILNVLPRMLKINEARRSTMEGVAKAPKSFEHGDSKVKVKRHWEFPDFPSITAFSSSRIKTKWKPDFQAEFANTELVTTTNETKKTTSVAFFKRRALHAVVWSFLCDGNVMRVTFSYACRRYLYELCISAKAVNIRRSAISHSSS